jgi:biopolymer transport protein ExbB/TolQ
MTLTPSQRPTREFPLLVLALAVVGAICFPLWSLLAEPEADSIWWAHWDRDRWARLLFGPEQLACYCCFAWAGFILLSRYLEVRRQRRAFALELLPTDDSARILPEDAPLLQRRLEELTAQHGPFILAHLIRLALTKLAAHHASAEVRDTIRTQAEVEQSRLVSSMSLVHYLAWAIPAIGFLGTVRGLAGSLTLAGHSDLEVTEFIRGATRHLNVAFDCTLIALVLSLGVMFLIHLVQRDEEALVIDCQQYCLEYLVHRLYEPETPASDAPQTAHATVFADRAQVVGHLPERSR